MKKKPTLKTEYDCPSCEAIEGLCAACQNGLGAEADYWEERAAERMQ